MTTRKHIKVTYSTLGSPDPLLHEYYEDAVAQARLGLGKTHQMSIGGQWVAAEGAPIPPTAPSTPAWSWATSRTGMPATSTGRSRWRVPPSRPGAPPPGRSAFSLLRKVAVLISERLFDIAAVDSLEVGKNRLEALGDVEEDGPFICAYCYYMEEHKGFVQRQLVESEHHRNTSLLKPYGVWGVIAPFNFPVALSGGPTAAAILAGNTVVLKPAEDTPYSPTLLIKCFHDAGLPPGVVNMVTGQKETGRGRRWITPRWTASPSPAPTASAWKSSPSGGGGRVPARSSRRWAARIRPS